MTKYEVIYDRFLRKVEDVDLPQLSDEDQIAELTGWLNTAISRMLLQHITLTHNLKDKDDELQYFNDDLTDREIELLALHMVVAWYEPKVSSLEHTLMYFGTKEEKFTNQKDHLNAIRNTRRAYQKEARLLATDLDFAYNDYLGNGDDINEI